MAGIKTWALAAPAIFLVSFGVGAAVVSPSLAANPPEEVAPDQHALIQALVRAADSSPLSERQISGMHEYAVAYGRALSHPDAASVAELQRTLSCTMAVVSFREFQQQARVMDDIVDSDEEGHSRHLRVMDILSRTPIQPGLQACG